MLEAGIALDAIGLQTHMHQGYWGEEATSLAMVDRFARFGPPLHLTETTLLRAAVADQGRMVAAPNDDAHRS